MAKKNTDASTVTEDTTALAAPAGSVHDLTKVAAEHAKLTPAEKMRIVRDMFGEAGFEVLAGGKLPFWPALKGATIKGRIVGHRTAPTRFKSPENPEGLVGIFTLEVVDQPALAGNKDGEIFQVNPGDLITVLERKVLSEMLKAQGRVVGIHCLGKVLSASGNEYWDYLVGAQRAGTTAPAATPQIENQ